MRSITVFLTAIFLTFPVFAQAQSAAEIAKNHSQAVVVIETLDERGNVTGQGSGFIVTPGGAIISNLHVVRGAAKIRVRLTSGDVYQTDQIIATDDVRDIVIIKIDGFNLPTVRLGDSDRTESGESIVAISSPEGLANSISTGIISGMRRLETHRVFQITAPISDGSSGGAVFDSKGEVIGIITYLMKSGQNINFALPVNYARGMISDQVRMTVAQLPAPPVRRPDKVESTDNLQVDRQLDDVVDYASRGKLGRSPQEPMFLRPDQALAFFYRLVDGIGLYSTRDVVELTRTAAVVKDLETESNLEYSIKYLSYYSGIKMNFVKPDLLLNRVELVVTWSLDDVKNTFGEKFKKKQVDGQTVLDFGRLPTGLQLVALMGGNGNIYAIRYTRWR